MSLEKKAQIFILILLSTVIFTEKVYTMGIALHIETTDRASQMMNEGELKETLIKERAYLRSGTLFPDTGHILEEVYSEYTHWPKFINPYKDTVAEHCIKKVDKKCRQLLAHVMGVIGHMISDVNFDSKFLPQAAIEDKLGSVSSAQVVLDKGLDFVFLSYYPEFRFNFSKKHIPIEIILEILKKNQIEVYREDIENGHLLTWAALVGERAIPDYFTKKLLPKIPWSKRNFMTAKGGVIDTSWLIVDVWNRFDKEIKKGGIKAIKNLNFTVSGSWPDNKISLDYTVSD